jgi:hypothetical protein
MDSGNTAGLRSTEVRSRPCRDAPERGRDVAVTVGGSAVSNAAANKAQARLAVRNSCKAAAVAG